MNEEVLQNIYNELVSKKLTNSDYGTWKKNFSRSGEIQKNVHSYLSENNLTKSDLSQWKSNLGVKKKEVSEPTSAQKPLESSTQTPRQNTFLDTEEPAQAQASDGLGGPPKNAFGQEQKPVVLGGFKVNEPQPQVNTKGNIKTQAEDNSNDVKYWEDPEFNKGGLRKTVNYLSGIQSEASKSVMDFIKNSAEASSKALKGRSLFDEVPEQKPEYDKNGKLVYKVNPEVLHPEQQQGIISEIINSVLPENVKQIAVFGLNQVSNTLRKSIKRVDTYQENTLPKDNVPTEVLKGISGMVPDLVVAAALENPAAMESRIASWSAKASKKALPLIEKYAPKAVGVAEKYIPKATKFVAEGSTGGFGKVMTAKGAAEGMANAEENENPYLKAIEGGVKGNLEAIYMHGLGQVAGKTAMPIAKGISKSGLDSAISTIIATPLANAGVFTTARALRTGISEGRLLTPEEAAIEAGTGIGFSLLHIGSIKKNHDELNYYYDNVLKNDPASSLGRVLNETKENLDIAHNPNLTIEGVNELESARDEIKKAILREPDLEKKKILGNEALKIQNQLDAYSAINGIVENKDAVIDAINNNDSLDQKEKSFYTKKVEAIADSYDNSEFGLKKKELSAKVDEAQNQLDNAASKFSNSTSPSARAIAEAEVNQKRKELEELNKQLVDLVSNKPVKTSFENKQVEEVPVAEEVSNIDANKADIEKRRKEDIYNYYNEEGELIVNPISSSLEKQIRDPKKMLSPSEQKKALKMTKLMLNSGIPHEKVVEKLNEKFPGADIEYKETEIDRINAKYDAELKALEQKPIEEKSVPLHETLTALEGLGKREKLRAIDSNLDSIIKELGLKTENC